MKLLRYGDENEEKPGLLDDNGNIRDLSGVVPDINPEYLSPVNLERLRNLDVAILPVVSEPVRLAPPVADVGKIVCIGLNYSDHAKEAGQAIPAEPILFMKATSSICGPFDDVVIPRNSNKLDWEAELGIVIGQEAKYVGESEALDYVAGYCVVNDVSERSFQLEGTGQWVKGKSADTFCPFGPYLVTEDEIFDPQNLHIWLDVDDKRRQNGNTKTMIFNVAYLVSYVSQFMSLQPGDLIPTGTPPGVGLGHKPPLFLQPGNVVRLGIEGIGEIEQKVVKPKK